jgi:hypothetical protein
VSSIEQPRPASTFSSFSSAAAPPRAALLAFRFPSPGLGPGGGGRPVLVFHTAKDGYSSSSSHIAPPSLLFLPPAAPAPEGAAAAAGGAEAAAEAATVGGLAVEEVERSGYWEVAAGSGAEAAVLSMLAPFRAPPAAPPPPLPPQPPAAAAAAAAQQAEAVEPAVELEHDVAESQALELGAATAMEEAGSEGLARSGGSMEVDVGDLEDPSRPSTPDAALSSEEDEATAAAAAAVMLPEEEEGCAAGRGGGGGAAAAGPPAPPAYGPFDMFAAQTQQGEGEEGPAAMTLDSQEPAPAAAAEPPPFRLLLADGATGKRRYFYNADSLRKASVLGPTDPLFLVAEWAEPAAAAAAYDRSLWDRPAAHPSAVAADAAAAARGGGAAAAPPVSLRDCLETFLQPERLDADDSWYCSRCKAHVQAGKKLDLWRLPEVLVVHLKRFSYSRLSRDKLEAQVDFPLEGLDLGAYVPAAGMSGGSGGGGLVGDAEAAAAPAADGGGAVAPAAAAKPPPPPVSPLPPQEPPLYDLYAVSNHFGGLGGGHYTAFCRMPDDGTWHTFDDSSVREMDPQDVRSPAAYVLFYRRRGAADEGVRAAIAAAAAAAAAGDAGGSPMGADDVFGGLGGGRSAPPSLPFVGEVRGEDEAGDALALGEPLALLLPPPADVAAAAPPADEEDEVPNMEGVA